MDFIAGIFRDAEQAKFEAARTPPPSEGRTQPSLPESRVIGTVWLRTCPQTRVTTLSDGAVLVCSNSEVSEQLESQRDPFAASVLSSAVGSFAALSIHQDGSWKIATDRFASRPVYWAQASDQSIWLATDLRLLLNVPGIDQTLDEQAIYDFVHFHIIPGPRSVFLNIEKIGAAKLLEGRPGQIRQVRRYWPTEQAEVPRDRDTLLSDVADGLHTAVGRLANPAPNACFLSGGLDSSTIAGSLARHGETHAFTIGFDEQGYDEMAYAELAAAHFGLKHHTIYLNPDSVLQLLPDVARLFGEPFGNLSAIPAFACASMAREAGFETMLAGDGGDEFFAGNERYARHRLISHWQRLPTFIRRPLEPLLVRLVGSGAPLVHKIGRYVDIAKDDLPTRLREDFDHFQGFAPEQIFSDRFMSHVDRGNPMHLLRTFVDEAAGRDLLETLLQIDWRLTLADNDLRKVHYACKAAHMTPAYPMLDPDFVTLARGIPSSSKLTATRLRAVFKDAFSGFLPERIINKPKHGFGLPFGEWLRSDPKLRELTDGHLQSAVSRGLVQAPFVEQLLTAHREDHAAYFGTMIGALLMLEIWLASTAEDSKW